MLKHSNKLKSEKDANTDFLNNVHGIITSYQDVVTGIIFLYRENCLLVI